MYKSNNVNEGLETSYNETIQNLKDRIILLKIVFTSLILLLFICLYVQDRELKSNFTKLEKIQQGKIDSLQAITNVLTIEKKNDKSFTEENLVQYLNELNVKYVDVVLAQAKLESGNFNSYLFRINNNLFGMRKAEQRPTTTINTNKRYAVYSTWQQSVLDYALLQSSILPKVKSKKEYIAYIGKNYAELPHGEYEKLLKPFIQE